MGLELQLSPVTPALLQPSLAGKGAGLGVSGLGLEHPHGAGGGVLCLEGCRALLGAAGRSRVPWSQGCAGTPRPPDNRPPFPNPPGTARPRDATGAEPGDPQRAKSLLAPSAGARGARWDPPAALPRRGEGGSAPQHRRQLLAGCPSAVIWSSDIRAGTQPRSLSAQTPKQLSQLPSLVVFPCNVSPGSLPMTSLLHIPSPGRAEGTAGTPRISRAHYTHGLITARAAGDLPGLEGRAEGVEGEKFPWLCCVFPAEQGEPRYHMADINTPQLRGVPAPGARGGAALPRRGRRGVCQSLLPRSDMSEIWNRSSKKKKRL